MFPLPKMEKMQESEKVWDTNIPLPSFKKMRTLSEWILIVCYNKWSISALHLREYMTLPSFHSQCFELLVWWWITSIKMGSCAQQQASWVQVTYISLPPDPRSLCSCRRGQGSGATTAAHLWVWNWAPQQLRLSVLVCKGNAEGPHPEWLGQEEPISQLQSHKSSKGRQHSASSEGCQECLFQVGCLTSAILGLWQFKSSLHTDLSVGMSVSKMLI